MEGVMGKNGVIGKGCTLRDVGASVRISRIWSDRIAAARGYCLREEISIAISSTLRKFDQLPRGDLRKLSSGIEGSLINDGWDVNALVKPSTVLLKICLQSLDILAVKLPRLVTLER